MIYIFYYCEKINYIVAPISSIYRFFISKKLPKKIKSMNHTQQQLSNYKSMMVFFSITANCKSMCDIENIC